MAGRKPIACLRMTGVLPDCWIPVFALGACLCVPAVAEEAGQ